MSVFGACGRGACSFGTRGFVSAGTPWFGARTRSVLIAEPLPLLLLFAEPGAGGREPGLGRLRRPPARPAQRHLRLRAQAACLPDVAGQRDVLVERDADGMERGQLRREPVPHALALGLPRAEDPVPDDQDPAVVLVEVLMVHPVVNPVVRRCVEHALDPAWQPGD